MKKILLLLFTTTILLCGCGKKNDELIMVTEAGFAPYEYYDNNEIVGVDIDIANEIAKKLGKKLVIKDVAFDSIINEVKTGKADFGAAGISFSEERNKEVDFSNNYSESKQVIIVQNDSKITESKDLENKKIAVQLGSIGDSYISQNIKSAEIIRQKKFLSAVEDLKAAKVDAIVMDELPAKEIVKVNSGLKILPQTLTTDSYGMIVKKGNTELLNTINEVIKELSDSGKIDEYLLNHTK